MELPIHALAAGLDTVWVLLCAARVFFLEGGFAATEAGLIRTKNAPHIIMKVIYQGRFGDRTAGHNLALAAFYTMAKYGDMH